jgi:hypothetical protein
MAFKDSTVALMAKVGQMVTKTKTTWADLEGSSSDKSSDASKEALRELIETRRHNDMVRKREFEYLRKIRLQGGAEPAGAESHPSVLQTNVPQEADDRAQTLKKIDAIEAEMSRHWWRKRPKANADTVQIAQRVGETEEAGESPLFQKTEIMPVAGSESAVAVLSSDQRIHAAARAFASGDDMGAELHLLLVAGQEGGEQDAEVWLTLLDLYRATGQAEAFDARALEFVNRFGRSAPSWHNWLSTPESGPAKQPVWCSPIQPQLTDLMPLQMLVQPGAPLSLDWSRLAAMDDKTARALTGLCKMWSGQDLQLELRGASRLLAYLSSKALRGVSETDPLWWEARLAVLRLMGRAQEFEAVTMDFCVTYERSPPPWEAPQCRCQVHDPEEFPALDVPQASVPTPAAVCELRGLITGDARPWTQDWGTPEPGPLPWEIRCHELLRIDLAAATDFLDWLRLQHQEGYRIHLLDVNRLVAALLLSMQAGEWVRLMLRND